MINGKHFFSIHHNDLGLFLFSVTLATDSTYISVLYFRILFLYSERTYTLLQIVFLFFPQKQCTHCASQSTQSCTYSGLHTIEQKNLLQPIQLQKQITLHPFFCFCVATAPHPHHMQCFSWPSSESIHEKHQLLYFHMRLPQLRERVHAFVDFGHTLSSPVKKKILNWVEDCRIWREIRKQLNNYCKIISLTKWSTKMALISSEITVLSRPRPCPPLPPPLTLTPLAVALPLPKL